MSTSDVGTTTSPALIAALNARIFSFGSPTSLTPVTENEVSVVVVVVVVVNTTNCNYKISNINEKGNVSKIPWRKHQQIFSISLVILGTGLAFSLTSTVMKRTIAAFFERGEIITNEQTNKQQIIK